MECIDTDIKVTVMHIRELLMSYYKGTCVENMTTSGVIAMFRDRDHSGGHLYERLNADAQDKKIMAIGDAKIFTLTKVPNKLVFYSCLDRSPQFRTIKDEITKFMSDYLGGVELSYIKRKQTERDDSELMKMTRLYEKDDRPKRRFTDRDMFISESNFVPVNTFLNTEEIVF